MTQVMTKSSKINQRTTQQNGVVERKNKGKNSDEGSSNWNQNHNKESNKKNGGNNKGGKKKFNKRSIEVMEEHFPVEWD